MKVSGNGFIITGGLGGVGKAVATNILAEGGYVALFDVLPAEKGAELTAALDKERASYFKVSVDDPKSVEAAVQQAVAKLPAGKLVGAVHCAGIAVKREWTSKMSDSIGDFKKMLDVNTFGTFVINAYVSDAINSQYKETASEKLIPRQTKERGIIINFASAAANPYARVLCYGPTKTAVLGITTAASDYLGPSGIRVVSVSPGIVNTGMAGPFLPYFLNDLESTATFPRRQASLEEIWHGCKFLIEHEMLNGIDLKIDGGWRLVSGFNDGADPRVLAPGLE